MELKFYLTEPLHLVIQGEGKSVGEKMILLRTHLCDIQCEDCDTAYTWKKSQISDSKFKISIEKLQLEVINFSKKYHIYKLLITGGEPHLQQKAIYELISKLPSNFLYEVETTGKKSWTILKPFWSRIHFNFSPKIGALKSKKIKSITDYIAFEELPYHFIIKVVVSKENFEKEIEEIQNFQKKYKIKNEKIYLMPLGKTREELSNKSDFIIRKCFDLNYNFSTRMHILIYDNKKLV